MESVTFDSFNSTNVATMSNDDKMASSSGNDEEMSLEDSLLNQLNNIKVSHEEVVKPSVKFGPLGLRFERFAWSNRKISEDKSIKSVADIGCGNGHYLIHLKNSNQVTLAVGLEKNENEIRNAISRAQPTISDFILARPCPHVCNIMHGSITDLDHRLKNFDLFVCLEIIEHLIPEDLNAFVRNVFGYYKPINVFISTPNRDYNCMFNMDNRQFRHYDHKFEFSQIEFHQWCQQISNAFDYSFYLSGVGDPPTDKPFIGFATQIAHFRINNLENRDTLPDTNENFRLAIKYDIPTNGTYVIKPIWDY